MTRRSPFVHRKLVPARLSARGFEWRGSAWRYAGALQEGLFSLDVELHPAGEGRVNICAVGEGLPLRVTFGSGGVAAPGALVCSGREARA